MLDMRMTLLSCKRPRGAVLRQHLSNSLRLPEPLDAKVRTVLDASDRLLFGNHNVLSSEQRDCIQELWKELTVTRLRKVRNVESPS